MAPSADPERQPLLRSHTGQTPSQNEAAGQQDTTGTGPSASDSNSIKSTPADAESTSIDFSSSDPDNPHSWSPRKKLTNVGIIALMAILSPLASSMFTPGISQIAEDLDADVQEVIATTTGFVIMLGVGPLLLAPLSETFGRRRVYVLCFTVFT